MKYLLGIFLSIIIFGQEESDSILKIREHFNYVNNNLSRLEQRTFEETDHSTEGGKGLLYFDGTDLVKVSLELLGETGKLERELYFKNEYLLFIFDKSYRYNAPIYIDDSRAKEFGLSEGFNAEKTKVYEDRFYFENEKLIRWIDSSGQLRPPNDPEYYSKEKSLVDYSLEFKQ